MKKSLSSVFVNAYIFIIAMSFLLISTVGSYLLEHHLERSISENLYNTAVNIAQNEHLVQAVDFSTEELEVFREKFLLDVQYHDALFWIVNKQGEIILSTQENLSSVIPIDIHNFDPVNWGSSYYQIGNFFGHFDNVYLSVMAPITNNMTVQGYVCIHYQMNHLYQERSDLLKLVYLIFLLVILLFTLLIWSYRRNVHRPLQKITKGTEEFANGNLAHKIQVHSDDEMGYLSNSLNYMAEKLNQNGEYQRRFISNVSHDFRSPLTSIKGYVDAMLDGTIPVEMQEKYLKIISYETERLEKLTRSLLTLNQLDMQKRMMNFQKFDINQIIKSSAATFEGICTKRKIHLELILSGKELYAIADMEQIQQVLYNLISNAIKFSPDESSIILETTEKNGKIFISVKDHGIGIPKDSIHKIWDRFYKTDISRGKDQKGSGLGLSIVKEIISGHSENINVVSTEGVGSEFIFTLKKAR